MRQILHISDVHFGPPFEAEVAEGVLALIEARKPDLVVLSGDLTQRAKPEQFRDARRFVDRMAAPSLVVPGNHDVPMYRVWERVFAPYGAYQKHFAEEMEPSFQDEELLVVGVNTAFGWTIKDGRITHQRLLEVARLLEEAPVGVCKIVVAHHQLIPPPWFATQRVLGNASEAVDVFATHGVDLVLSGHLHQTYTGTSEDYYPSGRRPVVLLHSGTTTSSRGRGSERRLNSCNWVVIDRRTLTLSHLQWHPQREEFRELRRGIYPRHGVDELSGAPEDGRR